ncbi:Hypothetical_protein [Hexamita inflata]|uniref:Hypothetical_protein n=1 Tax=Hexamita inflata TaxID=28002 RepID=A0AA86QFY0_9EUKA|nr:Hypothetical protein HINF_LOCUS40102 [Hexamita inflata]
MNLSLSNIQLVKNKCFRELQQIYNSMERGVIWCISEHYLWLNYIQLFLNLSVFDKLQRLYTLFGANTTKQGLINTDNVHSASIFVMNSIKESCNQQYQVHKCILQYSISQLKVDGFQK